MFKKFFLYLSKHTSDLILFCIVFLVNFGVTFYAFNRIPQNIAYDEILLGKLALSLDKNPYTIFTSFADGHAIPYFYTMLLSFKTFGVNNFALRLPAALFGFLGSLIFYAIAKRVFKEKKISFLPISFIVAIIFVCLRWRINFVRFSFEMPYLLLIELLSTYYIFRCIPLRQGFEGQVDISKTKFLVFSGIFAGLAFHSYQPGRIFFLVPLLYLVIRKANLKHMVSYLSSFLVVALPLVVFLMMNPGSDGRVNQLNYLQNSSLSIPQKVSYFSTNIVKTASMFFYKGDANGRHNFPFKPALNPLFGLLFACGVAMTIWNVRKKDSHDLFFIVYFIVSLIPALLTLPSENPHMLRTYTAIPSIIIFIGLLLTTLTKWRQNYLFHTFILLMVFGGCVYDLRTYFIYQLRVMRNSFEVTCPIQQVIYRNTKTLGDLPIECRIQKNLF